MNRQTMLPTGFRRALDACKHVSVGVRQVANGPRLRWSIAYVSQDGRKPSVRGITLSTHAVEESTQPGTLPTTPYSEEYANRIMLSGFTNTDPVALQTPPGNPSMPPHTYLQFKLSVLSGRDKEKDWYSVEIHDPRLAQQVQREVTKSTRVFVEGCLRLDPIHDTPHQSRAQPVVNAFNVMIVDNNVAQEVTPPMGEMASMPQATLPTTHVPPSAPTPSPPSAARSPPQQQNYKQNYNRTQGGYASADRTPPNTQRSPAPAVSAPGPRPAQPNPGNSSTRADKDQLWHELLENPTGFYDNRNKKFSERSPDFKHKTRKENTGLWLSSAPQWVLDRLPELEGKF